MVWYNVSMEPSKDRKRIVMPMFIRRLICGIGWWDSFMEGGMSRAGAILACFALMIIIGTLFSNYMNRRIFVAIWVILVFGAIALVEIGRRES